METTEQLLVERHKTHGSFKDNAQTMQALKRICHVSRNWGMMNDVRKESVEMICHKLGRILSGDPSFQDHWDDIAGYAKLVPQFQDDNTA